MLDLALDFLNSFSGVLDGHGEVELPGFPAFKGHHSAGVSLKAFGVGVVGCRFEAGDVAVFDRRRVFPEREAGHLFE